MSASSAADCPYQGTITLSACSADKCTTTFFGACMQRAQLVDKSCFCTASLNEQGCSACNGTRKRTQYLTWLNGTCSDIEGWSGLSPDWETEIPDVKLLWAGNITAGQIYSSPESCTYYAYQTCEEALFPEFNTTGLGFCDGFQTSLWEPNIYNATEAAFMTFQTVEKSYSPWYNDSLTYYDPAYDYGIYLDLNGFCRSVIVSNTDTCGSGVYHSRLVLWASTFCTPPVSFGWPENWSSELLVFDDGYIDKSKWPGLMTTLSITPTPNICSDHMFQTWETCSSQRCTLPDCKDIVDAVSRSCFCKEMDLSSNCHPVGIERTLDFLWLNKTCSTVAEFPPLPDGWKENLLLMNSTYGAPKNFTTWPKCANANNCGTTLNDTVTNCTQTLCVIDPSIGLCNSTTPGVKPECYCSPVSFEQTCNTECKLSWEREQYLNWMNTTCAAVQSWHGLPDNWTALLLVQDSELLPWSWRIQVASGVVPSPNATITPMEVPRHCPSVASKLGAFAAVNVAMALVTPILGRRDVMKKLTRGMLGHRASSMWLLSGPLTVLLHVASNAVAATLIKHTPGFESVDVGQLILLWCTRPRLAWMIVILVPFQAADEIYFSVASSTLVAEISLQILGAYYMGTATNYARRQKFYDAGRLLRTPKGKSAMIMYAGSVIWLSVIFIAVAACIWSLLGMSKFVAALASVLRGLNRKARRHGKAAAIRASRLADEAGFPRDTLRTSGLASHHAGLDEQWEENFEDIQGSVQRVGERWQRLETYVTADIKNMRDAEKQEHMLRKHEKRSKKGKSVVPFDDAALIDVEQAYATWNETPGLQLHEVDRLDRTARSRAPWIQETRGSLDQDISRTSIRLRRERQALSVIDAKIACLDKAINHCSTWIASRSLRERDFLDLVIGSQYHKWDPTAAEGQILVSIRDDYRPLRIQRAYLIGLTTPVQPLNPQTQMGLKAIITELEARINCLEDLRSRLYTLQTTLAYINNECTKLNTIWTRQKAKRDAEQVRKREGNKAMLRKIALRTILGMMSCFIAQWVWWIGYVKVSDESYCPPKLGKITVIWIVFAVFGAMLGGSL